MAITLRSVLESGGGSGSLYDLVKQATMKNAGTGATDQSFTSVIGRRYLVVALRVKYAASPVTSQAGIQSGATIDTEFISNIKSKAGNAIIWSAIIVATATTVVFDGTDNLAIYMPLDD